MSFITSPSTILDSKNTSEALLLANQVFNGEQEVSFGFSSLIVTLRADVPSSGLGLEILFSSDGTIWYTKYTHSYTKNHNFTELFTLSDKYYKIRYTNGSENQTSFHLTTMKSPIPNIRDSKVTFPSQHVDLSGNLQVVQGRTVVDYRIYSNPLNNSSSEIDRNPMISQLYTTDENFTGVISNSYQLITGGLSDSGGRAVAQSKKYAGYQSAKTIQGEFTGILNHGPNVGVEHTNGSETRIGMFDDKNGIYFAYNPIDGVTVNKRNSGDNTVLKISQDKWNLDPFDGTGPSGIEIDWTKIQYFYVQYVWLGVGPVLFSIKINEELISCHIMSFHNEIVKPWISNPSLPIRYEVVCDTGSDTAVLLQGCSVAKILGGFKPSGRIFSISNGTDIVRIANSGETVLMAITGCVANEPSIGGAISAGSTTNTYYHQNIALKSIFVSCLTSGDTILIRVRLFLSGTPFSESGNTTWTDVDTKHSLIKYTSSISNFTTDNSIVLDEVYLNTQNRSFNMTNVENFFSQITSDINNIPDVVVVTAEKVSGSNISAVSSISWEEVY